jgi:cytochrome bd-type quinol oxidase subunit 1
MTTRASTAGERAALGSLSGDAAIALSVGAFGMIILIFAAVVVVQGLIDAFVLVRLWRWFIAPTFGLRPLSMPIAYGISLVAGVLQSHNMTRIKDEYKKSTWYGEIFTATVFLPLLALLCGWVVHTYIA